MSGGGELAGSVSGGCVESDVAEHAREALETGRPKFLSYGITDARARFATRERLRSAGEIVVGLARRSSRSSS